MSKRADAAALKAYPELAAEWMKVKTLQPMKRAIYQQGYEQAEKDTIERAIIWLKENWREYVWTTDNGIPHFGHWENDFCKAMEEE